MKRCAIHGSLRSSDSMRLKNLFRTTICAFTLLLVRKRGRGRATQKIPPYFMRIINRIQAGARARAALLYGGVSVCIDRSNIDSIFVWPDIIVGQDELRG